MNQRFQRKAAALFLVVLLIGSIVLVSSVGASPARQEPIPLLVGFYGPATHPAALGMQVAIQEINGLGPFTGADGQQYRFVSLVSEDAADLLDATLIVAVPGVAAPETPLTLSMPVFLVSEDAPLELSNIQATIFRAMTPVEQQYLMLANFLTQFNATERLTIVGDESLYGPELEVFNQALLQEDPTGALIVQRINSGNPTAEQVQEILQVNPQVVMFRGESESANALLFNLAAGNWTGVFVFANAFEARQSGILGVVSNIQVVGFDPWVNSISDRLSVGFTTSYLRRTGLAPTAESVSAYDTTWAVKLMIERVGADPATLVGALPTTQVISTTQGQINVAAYGNNELFRSVVVYNLLPLGGTESLARYDAGQIIEDEDEGIVAAVPSSTPQPSATPSGPVIIVNVDTLNVRNGPGLNYDRIGRLQRGTQAPILGTIPDFSWFLIQAPFGVGWVAAEFVEVFSPSGSLAGIPLAQIPPSPTPAPTDTPGAPADVVIDAVTLNPARPVVGQPFTATVKVRNAGQTATPGFAVAASWQPGNVFSSVIVEPLNAGESRDVTLQATLNGSGKPTVAVVADLNSEVTEANEGNNQFSVTYVVDAAAAFTGLSQAINSTDIDIDGGGPEFTWTAGGGTITVTPVAGNTVGIINGFTFDDVYAGLLNAGAISGNAAINVPVGTGLFGIRTSTGYCGVIRPENTAGSVITLSFRYYPIGSCA